MLENILHLQITLSSVNNLRWWKIEVIEYRRWLIFLFFFFCISLSLFSYRQGNSAKWKDIGAKRGIVVGAANVVHITTNFGVSICKACYQLHVCPKYHSTWHVGFVRPVHSLCKSTMYRGKSVLGHQYHSLPKSQKEKVKRHQLSWK